MITLQTRPIHVLHFWQASSSSSPSSSSLESFLHSCLVSSEPCQAGCCRRKPLPLAECSWSCSSLLQGSSRKRLVSAGLSRIATIYTTDSFVAFDSVAALPVERSTENAELDVCRDHADMATLPEAIDIFATSNGSVRFAGEGFPASNGASLLARKEEEEEEEQGKEVLMPFSVKEGTEACLQPLIDKKLLAEPTRVPHGSSLPFLDEDALSSAWEHEICLLEQEKLRRKRISEANKNKVPWNKGKKYNKQGMHRNPAAATNKDITVLDDDAEILVKEKQRRQRISTANVGRVPWNKGRQHSEETRRRIRERTTEAMKNPKIREKLRVHGFTLSDETKSKISAGIALMWEVKKKLKQAQENCEEEWKENVADAARMGHGDEDEYDWSSYDTILRDLKKAWRSNNRRKIKDPRQSMTSAHRTKISNAIKAKWADLSYRSSVEAAIQARREKQGTEHVKVKRRCRKKKCIFKDTKFHDTVVVSSKNSESDESDDDDDSVPNVDSMLGIGPEILQSIQKVLPAYRNPLNNEMLEKLKQIRANRRSKETNRSRALERARILMGEARMAAKALEAQAATDESALPPLQEAQQLLAEAAESFKAAGLGADFFMETSKGE